jgi:hypothetical protein
VGELELERVRTFLRKNGRGRGTKGEYKKMGEGEGEWVRRRIINLKKWARERDNAWEGEEKISLSLWHPSITLPHGMGGRLGGKKKCPLYFTLKRVKVLFFNFL